MRPKRVHGLLETRKPTVGSVTASHARPANKIMEAWKGSSCKKGKKELVQDANVQKSWSFFLITGSDTLTFLMLLVDTSKINMKGGKQPQLRMERNNFPLLLS